MDTATIVNIILCILSFILAVISVITVVITLRQNSKMIEESTRPYISIYFGETYFQQMTAYLIIKNYGASSTIINKFSCDFDLSKCAYDSNIVPFAHIIGTNLSPGEKIIYPIDFRKLPDDHKLNKLNFHVEYSSSVKSYENTISLNLAAYFDVLHLRANTKGQEAKTISFALQDIAEKML